ncbi:reticulocyte-binding protein PFD0110w isoform X1 [Biomphalaria glabrata]|nr:reticulocyte-binding protein PFD0110w isoform X1 [Biomphalaria glabrata]
MGSGSSKKSTVIFSSKPQTHQNQAPVVVSVQDKKHVDLSSGEIKKKFKRYLKIQKEIHEKEAKNIPKSLQLKKEHLTQLEISFVESDKNYKAACDKVAKEQADVDKLKNPSVKAFFKDQNEFDEKMSKEQEELLEALNEQEVAKKHLEGIVSQKKTLDKEIRDTTEKLNKLMTLYDEQDKILNDIFQGKYGSELENKLEEEVEQLLDRKERISVAKYKWSNGRLLLFHACNQLAYAVKRWQDLGQVDNNNMQVKFQLATETRNNLIAASQNIMTAKRYLNNIKFPYCEPEEIDTLNRATGNIYIDMQNPERHQHALQCYNVTHKRCAALLQWFDSVISNTIEKDLAVAKADLAPKEQALRNERLRLIREKLGDDNTEDIKLENDMIDEFDTDVLEPELLAISKPEGDNGKLAASDSHNTLAPTPLPLNELAPPPSQEDLFGNIEQLKKQHEKEMAQIEKAQETNKARIEQGLQEKLKERRTKRSRLQEE